jgi:hypothetical protein
VADTAVIAIIAGATTTLGVPIVSARFERDRRREERRDREVDAVRAVLNEGSLILEKLMASMQSLVLAKADLLTDTRPASEIFAEQQQEAQAITARLAILLGRFDEATIAFRDASAAYDKMEGIFDRLIGRKIDVEQAGAEMGLAAAEYAEGRNRFVDQATTLVGSHALRRRRRVRWPIHMTRSAP